MRIPEYRVWVTAPKELWLGCDEYETFDWDNRMRMVSSIHFPLGSYSGKDISAEAISEPDYYADGWLGANYSNENTIESFDYILMEYTGLKDKNGVKIFEGDILSEKWKVEVYKNDEGTFMVKFGTHPELNKPRSLKKYLTSRKKAGSEDTDCIIIGNIHQNPELL